MNTLFKQEYKPYSTEAYLAVIKKAPIFLLGLMMILCLSFFLYRAAVAVVYPYSLEFGEGTLLSEAAHLKAGGFQPQALYTANLQPPYQSSLYSPLFSYLQAFLMLFTGPTAFASGRLLSIFCCMLLAALFYLVGSRFNRAGRDRWIGIAVVITVFSLYPFYYWAVLSKPDMLALSFSLGAVSWFYWLLQRPLTRSYLPYLVIGILCVLALFSKQTALAAPTAISLTLLFGRRWRALGFFLLGGLGLGLAGLVFFQLSTNGAFLMHLVGYNSQPYSLQDLWEKGSQSMTPYPFLLVLVLVWVSGWFRGRHDKNELVWLFYLAGAAASALGIGRYGSTFNHFLEMLGLVALIAWWQLEKFFQADWKWRVGRWQLRFNSLLILAMIPQLVLLAHVPVYGDSGNTPNAENWNANHQIDQVIQQLSQNGRIFATQLNWPANQTVPSDFDDIFVFTTLANEQKWDTHELETRLENGYYRYVMIMAAPNDPNYTFLSNIKYISPEITRLLQDRNFYKPYREVNGWLFLIWQKG